MCMWFCVHLTRLHCSPSERASLPSEHYRWLMGQIVMSGESVAGGPDSWFGPGPVEDDPGWSPESLLCVSSRWTPSDALKNHNNKSFWLSTFDVRWKHTFPFPMFLCVYVIWKALCIKHYLSVSEGYIILIRQCFLKFNNNNNISPHWFRHLGSRGKAN